MNEVLPEGLEDGELGPVVACLSIAAVRHSTSFLPPLSKFEGEEPSVKAWPDATNKATMVRGGNE